MRSGLGFPVRDEDGSVTLGFENSAVYQDAADAFDMAQRSIVAALPGSKLLPLCQQRNERPRSGDTGSGSKKRGWRIIRAFTECSPIVWA